ncbi:nSTAND1 domain-containing NTPase [Streptomyces yaizuensis]|uniref:DNA-binding protein n=1 Tax=Streptomyces yaizuensis TaxID=2989713 RepID=A0ABQ5NY51_9ACTN|nr:DNA-binding protein [Streptomyces sp. YSPA8]GLF95152.1 DNA-binding protein [Streptomyces sp. YSPA8]
MQRFAYELRKLREQAGGLTYRAMARGVPYAVTTLSRAAAGEQLPSLAVTLAYVQACGGDAGEWERRWHEAEEECAARNSPGDDAESPYQGLARFEPSDHDRFFGRDRLVGTASELVAGHRFAAVFGPSGSGKSSLLRAGLVPALRKDGQGLAAIRILTPGEHPLRTHTAVLVPKQTGTDGTAQGDTLLVVDQFEEVFTLCTDPAERNGFIERLLAARDPESRLRVIIAVRADFYGRCAGHRGLADALTDASLLVGPMTPGELRETIVGPAQAVGLIVEREVTARLVADVGGESGGLPLLSHALRETWRRRRGRTLTMAAFEAAGGVHGAIARTAEDIYTEFTVERQALARQILLRMITPGDGTPDTRRPVTRTELDFGDPAETLIVVERLARARLLTLDDTTVDLAHEALITAWPRLNTWIEEARERLRAHRHLTEATHTWTDLGHDPGGLYRGARLAAAEDHFTGTEGTTALTPPEHAFLTASRTAHTTARRRRRTLRTTFTLVTVLALIAGVVAWQQNTISNRRHTEAEARRIASVADALRSTDPKRAMRLSVAAWRVADISETRSALLGAVSQREEGVLSIPERDLPHGNDSIQLTGDGRTAVSVRADRIKTWDLRDPRRTRTYRGLGELAAGAIVLAPNGRSLVFSAEGGTVVWDIRAGRVSGRLPLGESTPHVLSRDGLSLAVEKDGGTVEVWDVSGRRRLLKVVHQRPDTIEAMTFSADGRRLAVCTPDRLLEVWDVLTKKRLAMPWAGRLGKNHSCSWREFDLSPDGRTMAVATDAGIRRWDLGSARELPGVPGPRPKMLRFSEDGAYLIAATSGELHLWRWEFPEILPFRYPLVDADRFALDTTAGSLRYINEGEAIVRSLRLGPVVSDRWRREGHVRTQLTEDGHTLAEVTYTGGDAGIRLLDTHSGRVIGRPAGQPCALNEKDPTDDIITHCQGDSAFSADGRYFAYSTPGTDRLTVWDVAARREHASLQRPLYDGDPRLRGFALSPDGYRLYMSVEESDEDFVEIWDIRAGSHGRKVGKLSGIGGNLAVRRDGAGLVGSTGAFVDLHTRRVAHRSLYGVQTLAFSPNSDRLAVGDAAGRVTVWDGRLESSLATLMRADIGTHLSPAIGEDTGTRVAEPSVATLLAPNGASALAFSPDGATLAVGDATGSVHLWDVESSQRLGFPLPTPGDPVLSLAFSPDGGTLYASGPYSGLETYDLDPHRMAAAVCERAGSGLSRAEWRIHLPDLPYRRTC